MTAQNTQPRVYIACLSSYNAGTLYGEWIDADQDADSIREQIAAMLRNSPHPNTEITCPECDGAEEGCKHCDGKGTVPTAEEWAIHDYEGFEGIKLSEHEDIDTVAELAEAVEEHGEPFAIWWNNENRSDVDVERFQEQYRGTYRTLEDYASQLVDDMGYLQNCPDVVKNYFDYEAFARDLELGGDIWTERGGDGVYVFDNH